MKRINFIGKRMVAAFMLCSWFSFAAVAGHVQDPGSVGIGGGTTVVVIRSPKSIYAAVDSKLTYREYRDGQLSVTNTLLCKMKPVGPYYSMVAGAIRGTNGYNAQEEIARAYAPGRRIDEMLSALQTLVPDKLVPMFQTVRDIDPEAFDASLPGAELEVALMGMENNSPKVGIVEFHAVIEDGRVGLSAKLASCPGNCPGPAVGYFLGTHEAIEAAIRDDNSVLTSPSEQKIDQLMRLEFAARPDVVGGPVAMVRISEAGVSVLDEGACPAQSVSAASQDPVQPLAGAGIDSTRSAKGAAQPSPAGKAKAWIRKHKSLIITAGTMAL